MEPFERSQLSNAIRFLSIDAIVKAGEGHQGVPLGMAEVATALFCDHLKFNPQDPLWPDRDRFVLSNGHGSMLLYSLLYLTGYEKVSLTEIKRFRELDSICAGHPEYEPSAGIEVTTGPLGQGIANAMGMAVAEAVQRARFGSEVVDHYTYAFVGDGCLQEGIGQEMVSLAGHLQLGHLILLWDDNSITDDGTTSLAISENVPERFRLADWHVIELDGHDITAISAAIATAKIDARPSLIACKTVIGKGLERVQGRREGHSARLYKEDALAARQMLGWESPDFVVPQEILVQWRGASLRNLSEYANWHERISKMSACDRDVWERMQSGKLPEGWQQLLSEYKSQLLDDGLSKAGIMASAEINDLFADVLPERMVTCADLEAPTSHKRRLSAFTRNDNTGSYIHCGVREHLMGAMANGMAAHGGIIPLAVTYLAFSDYERPAMRMAALMGLPVKFVFSHDSIGVGKNGPTHQPVEILASLRAMPNMYVFRPADAIEAAECWEIAMTLKTGPSALVFARQELPIVRTVELSENQSKLGAYILCEAEVGQRQVTLIATGSEVSIACAARRILEDKGVGTAVISMPCWELFDQQIESYRTAVIPRDTVIVAIEAAVKLGWERYIGVDGGFIGMSGFGLSGDYRQLYEHFGITTDKVVELVDAMLSR